MERQCPHCQYEYVSLVNYCPKCGKASKGAPEMPANEPAPSQPTTRVGAADLSSQSPAQKVVLLSGRGDDAEPHAPDDAKDAEPTPNARRRSRKRALRADEPVYHRSVRALAITTVVCNVLMMGAVIGLALNFSSSTERLFVRMHEQFMQLSRDTRAREEADQKTNSDTLAALRQAQEAKAGQQQPSKAEFEDIVKRAVRSELVETRLAALPVNLSADERRAIRAVLGPLVAGTTGKVQRNLSLFEKKFAKNARRKEMVDEFERVRSIPPISQDEQVQAKLDKVEGVLMGDD